MRMNVDDIALMGVTSGGSVESLPNAENEAREAKSKEASRCVSQANEEAEEAKRDEGKCGRCEKSNHLAFFQCKEGSRPPSCFACDRA